MEPTITINGPLSVLGKKVKDRVTGMEGIATSVSFDLYGCIQVLIHPGLKDDGTPRETRWFDSNRLTVTNDVPVMEPPSFIAGADKGPEAKPPHSASKT